MLYLGKTNILGTGSYMCACILVAYIPLRYHYTTEFVYSIFGCGWHKCIVSIIITLLLPIPVNCVLIKQAKNISKIKILACLFPPWGILYQGFLLGAVFELGKKSVLKVFLSTILTTLALHIILTSFCFGSIWTSLLREKSLNDCYYRNILEYVGYCLAFYPSFSILYVYFLHKKRVFVYTSLPILIGVPIVSVRLFLYVLI